MMIICNEIAMKQSIISEEGAQTTSDGAMRKDLDNGPTLDECSRSARRRAYGAGLSYVCAVARQCKRRKKPIVMQAPLAS